MSEYFSWLRPLDQAVICTRVGLHLHSDAAGYPSEDATAVDWIVEKLFYTGENPIQIALGARFGVYAVSGIGLSRHSHIVSSDETGQLYGLFSWRWPDTMIHSGPHILGDGQSITVRQWHRFDAAPLRPAPDRIERAACYPQRAASFGGR